MDKTAIEAKLRTLITPYVPDKSLLDSLKPETDLIADLHINSADLVDIILDAEDVFDIEIDDDAAERMITVEAAIDVISERVNQA